MSMGRLTPDQLESVLQQLTYKISMIEPDILIRHRLDREKSLDDLAWRYQNTISALVSRLHAISRKIFQNSNIAEVRLYKEEEDTPEVYRSYLNTLQNVTDLVCYDILSKQETDVAVIVTERWIYILKCMYEMNDFFIVSALCNALSSDCISKSRLIDYLSDNSRDIHLFFEKLIPNQASIYQLQKTKFENGDDVVPILSTLSKMMDGVEQLEVKYGDRHKRKISNDFIDMQERIKQILDSDSLKLMLMLSHAPVDQASDFLSLAKKIQASLAGKKTLLHMASLVRQIKLYQPHDEYYSLMNVVHAFTDRLNGLANQFRLDKDETKTSARVQKCMGVKNILQDKESSFQIKLDNILQLQEDDVCRSSKKIMTMLENIADVLTRLIQLGQIIRWRSTSGRALKSAAEMSSTRDDRQVRTKSLTD